MDENAMAELARAKKLALDSLVWHAGLDAWQTVAQLSPPWWAGKPAAAADKQPAKEKSDSGIRRLPGPNAPTAEAAEAKAGGGLLKRLFGFGKKKG